MGREPIPISALYLILLLMIDPLLCLQETARDCENAIGIQFPASNFKLTASEYYRNYYLGSGRYANLSPDNARLNHSLAWCVRTRRRDTIPWLMVDLRKAKTVRGVATQGFVGVNDYFVKSYKLAYSVDAVNWTWVMENNSIKVLVGNTNGVHTVLNPTGNVTARYVKIVPVAYHIMICLRLELYTCKQGAAITTSTTASSVATTVTTTTATSSSMLPNTPSSSPSTGTQPSSTPIHEPPTQGTTLVTMETSTSHLKSSHHSRPTTRKTLFTSKTPTSTLSTSVTSVTPGHYVHHSSVSPAPRIAHPADGNLTVPLVVGSGLAGSLIFAALLLLLVLRVRKERRRREGGLAELLVIEAPLVEEEKPLDENESE
ncbi:uncharacterized protein LOC5516913 isoform X2 [Nematostella vectensis]|uniref:uncharacterized protein LOC5516913 isoform X2 n=1 Tax=Nematostella vectensis TaxID=45351 RepID=UPI00139029BE|nr:uncharacterized protein LOC5516913 isoform X2 [Nematostella vectensis]